MLTRQVEVGDRLEWARAGEKDHCTVLEVRWKGNTQQGRIKVDGWAGDYWGWENMSHAFTLIDKKGKPQ
jgi:hypothetical protein